jgi:hypothetical protein
VKPLRREFDPELRVRQFQEDEAMRARNSAAKAEGERNHGSSSSYYIFNP